MSIFNNKTWWKAHVKALVWWAIVFPVSLFAFLIVGFLRINTPLQIVAAKYNDFVNDGFVVFVSCALAASVAIDYAFAGFKDTTESSKRLMYGIPIFLHVLIGARYGLVFLHLTYNDPQIQSIFNWVMIIVLNLYTIFAKTFFYFKSSQQGK